MSQSATATHAIPAAKIMPNVEYREQRHGRRARISRGYGVYPAQSGR
jgi:hypothetical protein